MASVEDLYRCYAILDQASSETAELSDTYTLLLTGVKGSLGAKKLSAGFIVRFFPLFPELSDKAIEALIDLCEDEDIVIRKLAIQYMPDLCRDDGDNSSLSDILAQLLLAEDKGELQAVEASLEVLLRKDPVGALTGLFFQLNNADEACRSKSLHFLSTNVVAMASSVFKKDKAIEQYTLNEIKKALPSVTSEEFPHFMKLLSCLHLASTPEGAQQVVDGIAICACLADGFEADDNDGVDRLIVCARNVLPSIRRGASAWPFIEYLVAHLDKFPLVANESSQLELYGCLSSLFYKLLSPQNSLSIADSLFSSLLVLLPAPPVVADTYSQVINFRTAEHVLFCLHQVCKQCPGYLTDGEKAHGRLLCLRQRLHYAGVKSLAEQKSLKASLEGRKLVVAQRDPVLKSKYASLQVCMSFSTIIKPFFKNPPAYKDDLLPPSIEKETLANMMRPVARKRSASNSSAPLSKLHPKPFTVYRPPHGKFSKVTTALPATSAAKTVKTTAFSFSEPANPLMRGEDVATAAVASCQIANPLTHHHQLPHREASTSSGVHPIGRLPRRQWRHKPLPAANKSQPARKLARNSAAPSKLLLPKPFAVYRPPHGKFSKATTALPANSAAKAVETKALSFSEPGNPLMRGEDGTKLARNSPALRTPHTKQVHPTKQYRYVPSQKMANNQRAQRTSAKQGKVSLNRRGRGQGRWKVSGSADRQVQLST